LNSKRPPPEEAEVTDLMTNKVSQQKSESSAPFRDSLADYAGLCPVPCDDKSPNRVKWKSLRKPFPMNMLVKLVDKYPDDNIGILTGKLSGVFIVDVDDPDQMTAMLDRFGDTPIITQTPSGGFHLWYKWRDEGCGTLKGVDLKGAGGFIVCPPSYRREGTHAGKPYMFIKGSLADITNLIHATEGSFPKANTPKHKETGSRRNNNETSGDRNKRLFDAVREAAPRYQHDALLAFAQRYNETEFTSPLDECEVKQVVGSVTKYKEEGRLLLRGGDPVVIVPEDVLIELMMTPRALGLHMYLLSKHSLDDTFAIVPPAMAPHIGWSKNTIASVRDFLVDQEFLELVARGKRRRKPDGTWKNDPNIYKFHRNPVIGRNTTLHPSLLSPAYTADTDIGSFAENVIPLPPPKT
jgi:hypothetical protein